MALLVLILVSGLTGCLFSINHPIAGPDGELAVFLQSDGSYSLFPEAGVLHLQREGEWIPVPAATLSEAGALLAASPDGSEYLYVELRSGELFEPMLSTLYRVEASPNAVPARLLETERMIARAVWREEGIVLLSFGEEELGRLEVLDPETGTLRWLFDDLLSFEWPEASSSLLLIGADRDGDLAVGRIGRWDPSQDDGEDLASFVLNKSTAEAFTTLPHSFFCDVSPDGQWIALALYDQSMIEPSADVAVPAVYLIDVAFDSAERIAAGGMMPAFSADGRSLAYVGTEDGATGRVMLHDLGSGETTVVPGTERVESLLWLGPGRLGVTFEVGNDLSRLVEIDVASGTSRELIAAPKLEN